MKIVIVEDESFARKRIVKLLGQVDIGTRIRECESGKAAITTIEEFVPDLIFLDVNLQDMSGFDVLQRISLDPKPIVVFVTAFDYYAPRAFDFEAFDFLLKPFKNERFFRTMEKVQKMSKQEANENFEKRLRELVLLHESSAQRESSGLKLPIKLGNKTLLVDTDHIHYIAASGYYAEIFTEDNKYVTRESLNNLIEILDNKKFLRVHRSTIINIDCISEIVHSDYSELDVRMKDKKLIRVSKSYKKEFLQRLGLR